MGRILSFVPRQAATNRSPRAAGTADCVIIFPGVRYERPSGDKGADGVSKAAPSMTAPLPRR